MESEEVIQLEKEIYQVPKFMMVTINLLDKNLLVCDDKQSVSFINPLNMQKIATIPLPNEGAYLYSAYLNKTNKTVFMGFDNKKIIGVDSERYTNKSTMTLEIACLKFAKFHADPDNFVIMACEKGIIKIFNPARNSISATFDIE